MSNKDTRILIMKLIIHLIISLALLYFNNYLGLFYLFLSNLFTIIKFLRKRDEKVKSIVRYLENLNQGIYEYDISAYEEGELSKLLSELNKTTIHIQNLNLNLIGQKQFLLESLENISHQLKTPISSLLLLNELQDKNDLVNKSYDQIQRLNYLTESLLKLVRMDANIEEFDIKKNNLKEVVIKSINLMEPQFEDININLSLIDSECYFDEDKTLEAIINVLNNKSRFAKENIYLDIKETKLHSILYIKDDGGAIDNNTKENIFLRFYSGENKTPKSIGIGLSIAKEIMSSQEGSLYIEGKNTFVFKFTKFI